MHRQIEQSVAQQAAGLHALASGAALPARRSKTASIRIANWLNSKDLTERLADELACSRNTSTITQAPAFARRHNSPINADEPDDEERAHHGAILEDEAEPAVLDAVFDAKRVLQRRQPLLIGPDQNVFERKGVEEIENDEARLRRTAIGGEAVDQRRERPAGPGRDNRRSGERSDQHGGERGAQIEAPAADEFAERAQAGKGDDDRRQRQRGAPAEGDERDELDRQQRQAQWGFQRAIGAEHQHRRVERCRAGVEQRMTEQRRRAIIADDQPAAGDKRRQAEMEGEFENAETGVGEHDDMQRAAQGLPLRPR